MGRGFHIAQPTGYPRFVETDSFEERMEIANELIGHWETYCLRNWDNDHGDLYSPEMKVKRF